MQKKPIILGLVAVLLTAVAVWYFTRPGQRFIASISPIGKDEAVLMLRTEGDDSSPFFVELVHARKKSIWTTELTPIAPQRRVYDSEITADERRIFVFGRLGDTSVVVALDRANGRELWRRTMGPDGSPTNTGPILQVDDTRLIVLHPAPAGLGAESRRTITVLETATGTILWPSSDAAGIVNQSPMQATVVSPGRIFLSYTDLSSGREGPVHSDSEVRVADGALQRRLPFLVGHKVTPRGVLGYGHDGLLFFPRHKDGIDEPHLLTPVAQYSAVASHVPLGIYQDLIIACLTDIPNNPRFPTTQVLFGIDIATSGVKWRVEIEYTFEPQLSFNANGQLPRFFPVYSFTNQTRESGTQTRTRQMDVVDLQTGKLVSEATVTDAPAVLATKDSALIYAHGSNRLDRVDQETGAIVPISMPNQFRVDFIGVSAKFDQLWYYSDEATPRDELQWGVIDIRTGTIVYENGDFGRE